MLAVLYGRGRVTDCQLLDHMVRRNVIFDRQPQLLRLSHQALAAHVSGEGMRLAGRLLRGLPYSVAEQLVAQPGIAPLALCHCPALFHAVPESLKTAARLAPLLASLPDDSRQDLLAWIAIRSPGLDSQLEPIAEAIRRHAGDSCDRRAHELTPELRRLAVTTDYSVLPLFDGLDPLEYSALCDLALEQSGRALSCMDEFWRTAARVDRALAHPLRPALCDIPVTLYSPERLRAAIEGGERCRLSGEFLDHWALWDSLKTRHDWLLWLPEEERTQALCRDYLARFPGRTQAVPAAILAWHPDWVQRSEQSDVYLPLRDHRRVPSCYGYHSGGEVPAAALDAQPWALALASWDQQLTGLSREYRQAIVRNGGASGLADLLQAPPFFLEPEALLDPVQEEHCSRRAALLPDQARKALLCSPPFRLRRQAEGRALIRKIDDYNHRLGVQMLEESLPCWPKLTTGGWEVRGGRTLVREQDGCCFHLKLQRQGETVAAFATELVVQKFAWDHYDWGWHSEIPWPEGLRMLALEDLPVPFDAFEQTPEVYDYRGKLHCLALRFATRDTDYDTRCWQPDTEQGGTQRSRQGLLRALHDLGIWSSLGAAHTSTIPLYHQFRSDEARPALILTALFNPETGYPGRLHLWNSLATEASDWGWSGLRDLGDLEFYPFIASYIESRDACPTLPDYGRRASFVNAIAQNILASLLHYMRLERAADPDYHYRNEPAVARLAQFLEDGCDTLLEGLLGDGTRLRDFFGQQMLGGVDVYSQWRQRTAEEMIYWTARQVPGGDCFAEHFRETGRPSALLYPGHPRQPLVWPQHFTDPRGENLGAHNRKLPLFFLVRGLYMLAIGLTQRLADKEGSPTRSD